MTDAQALGKTLYFQLEIQSDNESLLYDATLEARSAYNEPIRLAKQGVDWDVISDRVADDAHLDILKTALKSDRWKIETAGHQPRHQPYRQPLFQSSCQPAQGTR
jgi:hypothetical protein